MSLETWKKEFYPTDAEESGALEATLHSLRKWEGLTKRQLAKHKLRKVKEDFRVPEICEEAGVADGEFTIGYDTCSLCLSFDGCEGCPLVEVNSGFTCDGENFKNPQDSYDKSAYQAWVDGGDARPMLTLLRKAKRMLEAKENADS
jgi:hypothetical protein